MALTDEHVERVIRKYFDGCTAADLTMMKECLTEDCVHYFPPAAYGGAWKGADFIAGKYAEFVATKRSSWAIDHILVNGEQNEGVVEWTHYKTREGIVLRGAEWHLFDPESGLIKEIRAYYASPAAPDMTTFQLEGSDYAGRGYSLKPPVDRA